MDNIFAYIVLACQKSLQEDKLPAEELAEERSTIARTLIQTNRYGKDRIMSFLVFLKSFLFIRDKEINSKFDQYIYQVTGGTIEMGVIETIKRQEREKGLEKGLEKGKVEGKLEGKIEMLRELGFTITEICQKLGMTKPDVEKYFKGA